MTVRSFVLVSTWLLALVAASTVRADDPKPYTATGKPEDRDYWFKDTDQHWEKVADGKWIEIVKDKKYNWVEKDNTKQYIEMSDASRNLTIRLSDDACTWLKDNGGKTQLLRLYGGKWGKPEPTAKPPDSSKSQLPDSSKSQPPENSDERDYWAYADGRFESLSRGRWMEIAKNK